MASSKVKPILLQIPLMLNRRRFLRRIAENHFKALILIRERQKKEKITAVQCRFSIFDSRIHHLYEAHSRESSGK